MECHGAADASRSPPAGRARAGTVAPRQRRLDTQNDQVGSNTCLLRVSEPAVKVRYDRRHLAPVVPRNAKKADPRSRPAFRPAKTFGRADRI